MHKGIRITSFLLICSLGLGSLPAPADTLATEDALAVSTAAADGRFRLQALLARDDVQLALMRHGVGAEQAAARIAAMPDEDVLLLQQRIDSMPAGGDVVGVLVFLFLVLLVTDILGLTKIFPFTRPIR